MDDSKTYPFSEKGDHKIHDGKCTFSKGIHLENYLKLDDIATAEGQLTYVVVYPGLNNNVRVIEQSVFNQSLGVLTADDNSPYLSEAKDYAHRRTSWWHDIQAFELAGYTTVWGQLQFFVTPQPERLAEWRLVSSSCKLRFEQSTSLLDGYWEAICHELPYNSNYFKYNQRIKEFILNDEELPGWLNAIDWPSHCSYRHGKLEDLNKWNWDLPIHNHSHDFNKIHVTTINNMSTDIVVTGGLFNEADETFLRAIPQMYDRQFHCWSIRFLHPYHCVEGNGISFTQDEINDSTYTDAVNLARTSPGSYTWTSSPGGTPAAVGSVTYSNVLNLAAETHANDMVARDYFSHDSEDGSGGPQAAAPEGKWHYDRAEYFGWGNTFGVQEAIYYKSGGSAPTPTQIVQAWANSGDAANPNTHAGILSNTIFDVVGFSLVQYPGETKWVAVLLLGNTDEEGVTNEHNASFESVSGGETVCTPSPLHIHSVHNIEVIYHSHYTDGRIREYASAQRPKDNVKVNPAADRIQDKTNNIEYIQDGDVHNVVHGEAQIAQRPPMVSPDKRTKRSSTDIVRVPTRRYKSDYAPKWYEAYNRNNVGASKKEQPLTKWRSYVDKTYQEATTDWKNKTPSRAFDDVIGNLEKFGADETDYWWDKVGGNTIYPRLFDNSYTPRPYNNKIKRDNSNRAIIPYKKPARRSGYRNDQAWNSGHSWADTKKREIVKYKYQPDKRKYIGQRSGFKRPEGARKYVISETGKRRKIGPRY